MEAYIHTCRFHPQYGLYFGQKFTNESIFEIIQDIALKINYTLEDCSWRDVIHPCVNYFTSVLTSEGVCFSFNDLNSNEIYTDEYVLL